MTPITQQTLYALFCLSRDTRHISASSLAAALGLTATRTAAALVELERAGLVDASRARLTMLGLATAVRLGSAAGGPKLDLGRARPAAPPQPSRLPVAAAPAQAAPPLLRLGGDRALPSPLA
jgi:hypothetical protein